MKYSKHIELTPTQAYDAYESLLKHNPSTCINSSRCQDCELKERITSFTHYRQALKITLKE